MLQSEIVFNLDLQQGCSIFRRAVSINPFDSRIEIVYLSTHLAICLRYPGNLDQGKNEIDMHVYNTRTGNNRELKFGEHEVKIGSKKFVEWIFVIAYLEIKAKYFVSLRVEGGVLRKV